MCCSDDVHSSEDTLHGSTGDDTSESATGGAGGSAEDTSSGNTTQGGTLYEALILQLGSFYRYKLYIPPMVPVDGINSGSNSGGGGGSGSGYGSDRASNSVSSGSDGVVGPASTTVYRRLGTANSYSTSSYLPTNRQPVTGELISCHLYRRNTNPVSDLLLPADVVLSFHHCHEEISTTLFNPSYYYLSYLTLSTTLYPPCLCSCLEVWLMSC